MSLNGWGRERYVGVIIVFPLHNHVVKVSKTPISREPRWPLMKLQFSLICNLRQEIKFYKHLKWPDVFVSNSIDCSSLLFSSKLGHPRVTKNHLWWLYKEVLINLCRITSKRALRILHQMIQVYEIRIVQNFAGFSFFLVLSSRLQKLQAIWGVRWI